APPWARRPGRATTHHPNNLDLTVREATRTLSQAHKPPPPPPRTARGSKRGRHATMTDRSPPPDDLPLHERQQQPERTPPPRRALGRQPPAMRPRDAQRRRQPQPRALADFLRGEKRVEN